LATEYSAEIEEMQSSDNKRSELKSFIFLTLIFLTPFFVYAQKWEIGGAIGGGNYVGDVNPAFRFENYQPAGGIFGRYNFSHAVSAKLAANVVKTHGSDDFNNDRYSKIRNEDFIRVVGEVVGQIEYNFFDYRNEKNRRNWTPYFFIGGGVMYMHGPTSPAKKIQSVIPTGIGFRKIINGKWNFGLELGARKTFTDYFDHLSGSEANTKFRNGNEFDRDWYFVSTISISYTFYSIPCPFYFD